MRQPDATTAAQRLFACHRDTVEGYLFIAPFLCIYLVFLIYPFLKGIWISLHEWDLLAVAFNPAAKILIGLENYVDTFWASKMAWGQARAGAGMTGGSGRSSATRWCSCFSLCRW